MNTQEKELKHCTACNQMTNHSGETCLKHIPDTEKNAYSRGYKQGRFDADMDRLNKTPTPDTEWERQLRIDFEVAYGRMPENFEHVPSVHISDWWLEKLSSHTTHWKERVRKEVEGMRKKGNNGEGLPFENSPEIYGNARMEAWKNGHNKALDTLLDNLK